MLLLDFLPDFLLMILLSTALLFNDSSAYDNIAPNITINDLWHHYQQHYYQLHYHQVKLILKFFIFILLKLNHNYVLRRSIRNK